MNKFTLGMVAGMSTLTLAVPVLAQLSLAADETAPANALVPSQACVEAMVALEDQHLANFDQHIAAQKTRIQERRDALATIADIADDSTREEALKQLRDDLKSSREDMQPSDEMKAAMDAVRTACGDAFRGHGPMGFDSDPRGPRGGMLAEKLGMTEEELKSALDSGKTIEEIAAEKGIELPARPEGFGKGRGIHRFGAPNNVPNQ